MTDFVLHRGWPLLLSVSVKSLFVLALAGLAALTLRRHSAAARHLVWRLALLGLLLLPLLSLVPAVWRVPLWNSDTPSISVGQDPIPSPPTSAPAPEPTGPAPVTPLPAPPALGASGQSSARPLPWPVWGFGLWLAGVLLTLLPYLLGLAGVHRFARQSRPVPEGPLPALTTALAADLGCRRPVTLLLGDVATPMTWGWRRPVILLPVDAETWPLDRLRAVLLHELAHIVRGDWPAQMASHLTCALYWFHPGVWLAARQARIESERACDDRVLLAGVPAPDYARHLLDIARSLRDTHLPAALPMATKPIVEARLQAILSKSLSRKPVARFNTVAAGLILLLTVGTLTSFRAVIHEPAKLAATTPAAQDGFVLRAVQLGNGFNNRLTVNTLQGTWPLYSFGSGGYYQPAPDSTCLWIQPPPPPHVSVDTLLREYEVVGRASTGTVFHLPYSLADGGTPPGNVPQMLCVTLPAGYPGTYRYIDVTVQDHRGHRAQWRLTNLPKMKHLLVNPRIQTQEQAQGFTIKAAAWRVKNLFPPYSESSDCIMTGLHFLSAPVPMVHQWELDTSNPQMEWASESASLTKSNASMPVMHDVLREGWMTPNWPTPYASDIHVVEQNGELRQFETYDERVTFHHIRLMNQHGPGYPTYCVVTAAQSFNTPSGITVTLPRQYTTSQSRDGGMYHAINCEFQVSGDYQPIFLSHSSLCQKYHLPASVQIVLPKPYQQQGMAISGDTHLLTFTLPKPYPREIKNFTVIVRQRVDLQTIPLNFIIPVGSTPFPAAQRKSR